MTAPHKLEVVVTADDKITVRVDGHDMTERLQSLELSVVPNRVVEMLLKVVVAGRVRGPA